MTRRNALVLVIAIVLGGVLSFAQAALDRTVKLAVSLASLRWEIRKRELEVQDRPKRACLRPEH